MSSRGQVILVAVLLAAFAAVDFYQRVYVPRAPAVRDADIVAPALPPAPPSLAEARQRMQSWLPATDRANPQTVRTESTSQEQGASVQLPDRADIAGSRFVLRGVFMAEAGPRFAVLEIMSNMGTGTEQHDVTAGQDVRGVRVEQISRNGVTLSDGNQRFELVLFVDPGKERPRVSQSNE